MDDDKLADFLQFAQKYKNKLKQIGNATKQEYTFEDVQHEAWILVETWRPDGIPINLCDSRDIDRLFAYLYAKLVKHNEKNIRYSVRLDHYSYGDSEDEAHPLMSKLKAPDSSQPLDVLLAREAATDLPQEPEPHESRAAAYLYLLQCHDNKMKDIADYLLISLSYCYFRIREARKMASIQCVLPDTIGKPSKIFFPGPWRSFRLYRTEQPSWLYQPWIQIELDLLLPMI